MDCDYSDKHGSSEVAFSMDSDQQSFFRNTGTEGQHSGRVFSTVRSIMNDHVKKYKPKTVTFTGSTQKTKLYDALTKRSGYPVTVDNLSSGGKNYTLHINEELMPQVYRNVNADTLMRLARHHGTTRFSIQKVANAGNAHHFAHFQLCDDDADSIDGAIKYDYKTGKHIYYANRISTDWKSPDS